MRSLAFAFLMTAIAISANSQSNFKRNFLYAEAGGTGMTLSVNYERQLASKPGLGVHVGVGLGGELPVIPMGLKYLFPLRNPKSSIETGLGICLIDKEFLDNNSIAYPSTHYVAAIIPSAGYRHQTNYGLMWRANFTPVLSKTRSFPFAGVSLGWAL